MRDIAANILYVRVWISRIFDQPLLQHLKLGLVVPIDAAEKNSDNFAILTLFSNFSHAWSPFDSNFNVLDESSLNCLCYDSLILLKFICSFFAPYEKNCPVRGSESEPRL